MKTYTEGALRVWHIPQVPGKPFHVDVPDKATAILILNVLADYDLFQYEHNIKPDYCNASGVEIYDDIGEGLEWFDAEMDELEDQ